MSCVRVSDLLMMNWLKHTMAWQRILGLLCPKYLRNLGIIMLSGQLSPGESRLPAESSQINCSALKAPSHTL